MSMSANDSLRIGNWKKRSGRVYASAIPLRNAHEIGLR